MEVVQSLGYIRFLDVLSQRYAHPFFVLDDFIKLEQLHEFVVDVMTTINEETKEKYRWEYFLHKVFDKTYAEFLKAMDNADEETIYMTDEEIKNTVENSQDILDLF